MLPAIRTQQEVHTLCLRLMPTTPAPIHCNQLRRAMQNRARQVNHTGNPQNTHLRFGGVGWAMSQRSLPLLFCTLLAIISNSVSLVGGCMGHAHTEPTPPHLGHRGRPRAPQTSHLREGILPPRPPLKSASYLAFSFIHSRGMQDIIRKVHNAGDPK